MYRISIKIIDQNKINDMIDIIKVSSKQSTQISWYGPPQT